MTARCLMTAGRTKGTIVNLKNMPTGESVWAATQSKHRLTVRHYGPFTVDADVDAQSGRFRSISVGNPALVTLDWHGTYTIVPSYLTPATVPYVNAFLGDAGQVVRDWRAAKRGETNPARLYRLTADGNRYRKATDWSLRDTLNGIATPAGGAAPTPNVPAGIAVTQKGGVTVASFTQHPLSPVAPVATAQPAAPTVAPEPEAKPTITEVVEVEAEATGLDLPAGWLVIARNGEDLAIKERDLVKFRAAMQARFTTKRPHFLLAVGPTGVGKTEGLIAMAEHEGYVVHVVSCSGFETASDVYGAVEPDETGTWVRKPSSFWSALKQAEADADKGIFHLVVLDELTRARVAAQNAFIDPLHGQARLVNPVTGDTVVVSSNVTIVGTANIGAAYAGTEALDAALRSRFAVTMNVEYLPEQVEANIAQRLGLSKTDADTLAKLAADLRRIDKQTAFRSALVPGTRDVVQVARQALFDPEGVRGAWIDCIVERFSDEGRDPTKTEKARAVWSLNQVMPPPPPPVIGTDDHHPFEGDAAFCTRPRQADGTLCGNGRDNPFHQETPTRPFIHVNPTGSRP